MAAAEVVTTGSSGNSSQSFGSGQLRQNTRTIQPVSLQVNVSKLDTINSILSILSLFPAHYLSAAVPVHLPHVLEKRALESVGIGSYTSSVLPVQLMSRPDVTSKCHTRMCSAGLTRHVVGRLV